MQDEFELTYLIKDVPAGLVECPNKEILDIYLPSTAEHALLRLRKRGGVYEITKKENAVGTDSSHLIENTIPLTESEFVELATLPGKRVHKIRYYYTENSVQYEIDVFQDALAGLILVDVEFVSNEVKAKFVPPDWILADVTQEKFLAGGVLAGKSYADLESNLLRFGYALQSL